MPPPVGLNRDFDSLPIANQYTPKRTPPYPPVWRIFFADGGECQPRVSPDPGAAPGNFTALDPGILRSGLLGLDFLDRALHRRIFASLRFALQVRAFRALYANRDPVFVQNRVRSASRAFAHLAPFLTGRELREQANACSVRLNPTPVLGVLQGKPTANNGNSAGLRSEKARSQSNSDFAHTAAGLDPNPHV